MNRKIGVLQYSKIYRLIQSHPTISLVRDATDAGVFVAKRTLGKWHQVNHHTHLLDIQCCAVHHFDINAILGASGQFHRLYSSNQRRVLWLAIIICNSHIRHTLGDHLRNQVDTHNRVCKCKCILTFLHIALAIDCDIRTHTSC